MKKEIWKPIVGYERFYSASNFGRIRRNLKGMGTSKNRILKTSLTNLGYFNCSLSKNNTRKSFLVHWIIAKTFLKKPQNKSQVNHIDGDKKNNHISNLEYVTFSENVRHSYNLGLQKTKLTNQQVISMRKKFLTGRYTKSQLAKIFGIHDSTASCIIRRKSWEILE